MRKVSLSLIETVFDRVIDKLKFEGAEEIEVKTDFYFNIPTSEWTTYEYTLHTESLFDDIDSLELLVKDKKRPCTYVDFERLAGLLRAISQIRNPV